MTDRKDHAAGHGGQPQDAALDHDRRARFARHLALPEIGEAGQARLARSGVLIVGVGGLGCPAALYLAAAGVGRITLVDHDRVELANLQRQVLFGDSDVGRPKVEAAAERLARLDASVAVEARRVRLEPSNADEILTGHDIVLEGSDNFSAKYAVSDAAFRVRVPLVAASVERFHAQVAVFVPPGGPCYRCLFPEPPAPGSAPSCEEAGVLGVLPGIAGTLQAAEALKLLLGIGRDRSGRLLTLDLLDTRVSDFEVGPNPECPACGDARTGAVLPVPEAACPDAAPGDVPFGISAEELAERLAGGDGPAILDVRMPAEWRAGRLAGATLVPLPELSARMGEIDPARETVVVCAVGQRSAHAVRLLRHAGHARARNLEGGLRRWAFAGLPLESGEC